MKKLPGHESDFQDAVKFARAAYEKARVDVLCAACRISAGMPGPEEAKPAEKK